MNARDLGNSEPFTSDPPTTISLVNALIDSTDVRSNRDLLREILLNAIHFAHDDASRLDLKIARSAIEEMAEAFRVFAPFRAVPKVTIFGSARTKPSDVLYALARDIAERLARQGWMVVTGAGPGIMAAGNEGAGRDMAIGVNIRLPFESVANPWIDDDKKIEMKYFFTRKLMLMKETSGFAVLPGGFGTLDECFELLTLLQTGKAEPAPIVLVNSPGETYWQGWEAFLADHVYARGLADTVDSALYRITDDIETAVDELLGFYRNYHSRRFVDDTMVIRVKQAPTDRELAELSDRFSDICSPRGIWRTEPLAPERRERDHLELARVALVFDRAHHGRLRMLIDALNASFDEAEP